jgi:hypothetical protein
MLRKGLEIFKFKGDFAYSLDYVKSLIFVHAFKCKFSVWEIFFQIDLLGALVIRNMRCYISPEPGGDEFSEYAVCFCTGAS